VGTLRLKISNRSGAVRVRAEGDGPLQITGAKESHAEDPSTMRIKASSSTIEVRCPAHTSVSIGTASGAVELIGVFGAVHVVTASGSVRIDEAASADVRTTSSSVRVHHCRGQCRVVTDNGEIAVENAGHVDVRSASGRVGVLHASSGDVRTTSGAVSVGLVDFPADGRLRIETISSKIDVSVAPGTHPHSRLRSMSGHVRCDCPDGADGSIELRSVSGSIRLSDG
jgi:DUF4097 and DUF4098 domain-containing protein YvlB